MRHDDVKKARLNGDQTRVQFAEELDINQGSLTRIENGDTVVSSQLLIDLARLLRVSPSKLLDGAVVNALAEKDLNRLGQVITFVEDVLQGQESYPLPETIRERSWRSFVRNLRLRGSSELSSIQHGILISLII